MPVIGPNNYSSLSPQNEMGLAADHEIQFF